MRAMKVDEPDDEDEVLLDCLRILGEQQGLINLFCDDNR